MHRIRPESSQSLSSGFGISPLYEHTDMFNTSFARTIRRDQTFTPHSDNFVMCSHCDWRRNSRCDIGATVLERG
jgi:hypothetical protein